MNILEEIKENNFVLTKQFHNIEKTFLLTIIPKLHTSLFFTTFGKEIAKFSLVIPVQSTQTHISSLLKELKDQQSFPIATLQTSILYIQHLIWL